MIKTRVAIAIIGIGFLFSGAIGFFVGKLAEQNMRVNELVAQRVDEMSAIPPALPKSFEIPNE